MASLPFDRSNKVTGKDNKTFQKSPLKLTSLKGQLIKGEGASREQNYWMIYVQGERLFFWMCILCISAAAEVFGACSQTHMQLRTCTNCPDLYVPELQPVQENTGWYFRVVKIKENRFGHIFAHFQIEIKLHLASKANANRMLQSVHTRDK